MTIDVRLFCAKNGFKPALEQYVAEQLVAKDARIAELEKDRDALRRTVDIYAARLEKLERGDPTGAMWLRALVRHTKPLEEKIRELEAALAKSIELQSHYALLLNEWDGGERLIFADASAWMQRLRQIEEAT